MCAISALYRHFAQFLYVSSSTFPVFPTARKEMIWPDGFQFVNMYFCGATNCLRNLSLRSDRPIALQGGKFTAAADAGPISGAALSRQIWETTKLLRATSERLAPLPGAPGPSLLGTGNSTSPLRATSERLAPPQVAPGAPGPSLLGTGNSTSPLRATSERLAPPQVAQVACGR
jgi:hypothetical protein